jgi:tRNA threonylcarbamoyl adenosine modification protein YeaZ
MRVGIATAQGLAAGLGIPTYGCSATVAWASGAPACALPVAVGLDARRGQVYSALYRVPADRPPEELQPVCLQDPDAWLAGLADRPETGDGVLLLGDGARLYGTLAREHLGARAVLPAWTSSAPNVGWIALEGARRVAAGLPGERLDPLYLRDHDAARGVDAGRSSG